MNDTFLEIKWRKEDIQNLLKDNGMDSSEQAVNNFIEKFDIQYFEEMCIQTGWEMLQSAISKYLSGKADIWADVEL